MDEEGREETSALIRSALDLLDATLQDKLEWNRPDTDILYRTVSQFRTFRKLVTGDNEKQAILRELLKHDFIGVVLTNAPVILRFVEATDEATRAIITMTRTSDDALTSQVIKRLFENGAVIFVVLAMKAHMLASQSIRVQGLELLTRMLEFVKKEHNRGESKGSQGGRVLPGRAPREGCCPSDASPWSGSHSRQIIILQHGQR